MWDYSVIFLSLGLYDISENKLYTLDHICQNEKYINVSIINTLYKKKDLEKSPYFNISLINLIIYVFFNVCGVCV